MLLNILYWVILVLSLIGVFAPATWLHGPRISSLSWVALFVLIGLRSFRVALN